MRISNAIQVLSAALVKHGDQQLCQWVYNPKSGKISLVPMVLEIADDLSEGGIGVILTKEKV